LKAFNAVLHSTLDQQDVNILADVLHRRWLSSNEFASIAAQLTLCFADLTCANDDIRFESLIFASIMNDYRDRYILQSKSKHMFRNSVYTMFIFYITFISKINSIVDNLPTLMLDYLDMLIEGVYNDDDTRLVAQLMLQYGSILVAIDRHRIMQLMIKLRQILIDHGNQCSIDVRRILLHAIELSICNWNRDMIADRVCDIYH
jgi:hypothetical protein